MGGELCALKGSAKDSERMSLVAWVNDDGSCHHAQLEE